MTVHIIFSQFRTNKWNFLILNLILDFKSNLLKYLNLICSLKYVFQISLTATKKVNKYIKGITKLNHRFVLSKMHSTNYTICYTPLIKSKLSYFSEIHWPLNIYFSSTLKMTNRFRINIFWLIIDSIRLLFILNHC